MNSPLPALAIARATWHAAARSHVLWILTAATLLTSLVLPLTLDGDGTPEGLAHLLLLYPPAATLFLLTVATLFLSCAALSREADARTLPLLLVKPIPRSQIWLGKWFALLALNALLLALAATLSYAVIRWRFLHVPLPTTLAALADVSEIYPNVEPAVQAEYARLANANRLPHNLSPSAILSQLRQHALIQAYAIPPNASRTWRFLPPPHPPSPTRPLPLFLQLKCDASSIGLHNLHLRLSAPYALPHTNLLLSLPSGEEKSFPLPPLPPSPPSPLTLTLANQPQNHTATLFFTPKTGLRLRYPAGTFSANYARAFLLLFLRLALLAAIGVTLGALFHLPVAAFLALALLLLLQISAFISHAAQVDRTAFIQTVACFGKTTGAPPGPLARTAANGIYLAYRATFLLFRPLLQDPTLDLLANATFIPTHTLLHTAALHLLLFPTALCLLSAFILRHREFPQT